MSIGGHQSAAAAKDEWLTPKYIIDALGEFDLDPCAPVIRPWNTAKQHYTIIDNGLNKQWAGRVWCNPPYGLEAAQWLWKCADHADAIALVFARTETKMFFDHVWDKAAALLFLNGRLYFHHVSGKKASANAGAPSVLIAYGESNVTALKNSGIAGKLVVLKP